MRHRRARKRQAMPRAAAEPLEVKRTFAAGPLQLVRLVGDDQIPGLPFRPGTEWLAPHGVVVDDGDERYASRLGQPELLFRQALFAGHAASVLVERDHNHRT